MPLPGPLGDNRVPFPEYSLHCPKREPPSSRTPWWCPEHLEWPAPAPGSARRVREGLSARGHEGLVSSSHLRPFSGGKSMFEELPVPSPSCPGPMCGAGWAWASWHIQFSAQLCSGGPRAPDGGTGSTLGCSGVAEACALGPTVVLQPGSRHGLLVIHCHNINHVELTWH